MDQVSDGLLLPEAMEDSSRRFTTTTVCCCCCCCWIAVDVSLMLPPFTPTSCLISSMLVMEDFLRLPLPLLRTRQHCKLYFRKGEKEEERNRTRLVYSEHHVIALVVLLDI